MRVSGAWTVSRACVLLTWGVHKVEVDKIVNAELFQLKNHAAKIASKNLGVGLFDELFVERLLCVEAESFARASTSCAPRSLLSSCLTDGADQQRLNTCTGVIHLLLAEPWVDHIDNTVNGERGLGNVGGDYDFAPRPTGVRGGSL